jgi:hypothetical protein
MFAKRCQIVHLYPKPKAWLFKHIEQTVFIFISKNPIIDGTIKIIVQCFYLTKRISNHYAINVIKICIKNSNYRLLKNMGIII